MLDLNDFIPSGTRIILKNDRLVLSRSGMRKITIHRFVKDEDLPVFFFGLGLFAGEGRHRFTNTTERIEFINSDIANAKLFHKFLEIIGLEDLVRARIHLKSDLDYGTVLDFWSNALSIPKEKFYRPLISPKTPSNTRVSQFGSIVLRINSALAFKLTTCWIQILLVNRV